MSLTSELAIADSSIRRYFDECLRAHGPLQKSWRSVSFECVAPPTLTTLRGEVGLAAGHLVAGLAVGQLGWGVGGNRPAAWMNAALAEDLDGLLNKPGLDLWSAANASWFAGLFDRVGRGFESSLDPLLRAFSDATNLWQAFKAVPAGVVDDLVALATANASILDTLPRPRVICPAPSGSGLVGGADGDLIAGSMAIEIKTVVDASLNRDHLRQLVAYPLLDFDDEWGISHVALWSLRFARLEVWVLDELLSVLAGRPTTLSEQRQLLHDRLVVR